MATPAADAPPRGASLDALLRPGRERSEMALRLAVICTLAAAVTEYYGTPEPALTAYLVFFLNRPERTTSLIFNVALVVVISIVIALIFPLAAAVIDAPAWRVAAMTLASIFFLFLASASKLKPIGPIVAMIVAYALDLLGFVPLGELATRALLYAWLFVAIPAGVSLVVNLLAAPAPRRLAERSLADRLRVAAAMLRGNANPAQRHAFEEQLEGGGSEILARLHLAGVEHMLTAEHKARLEAAAQTTTAILFLVDAIGADRRVEEAWRAEAADVLDEMAAAFEAGGYPVDIELPLPGDIARLDSALATLLTDLRDTVVHFTDLPTEEAPQQTAKAGFFLPDAFTNPLHLHYALKTTAAAMFCYFLYVLLDWPGIHTCLITCYIVALGTTAETVEKLSLRIVGCLAGAAVGTAAIVWVIPAIDSIYGLLAVVFTGSLIGGWIAAGSPRIAYAGFQFAFAFFLCVLQGTGPDFDLTIARDRVIGILIGNIVTYLVFTLVWPVSLSQRVEAGLSALLADLAALGRKPLAARRRQAPALQSRIAALGDDLALISYEPEGVRPPAPWLAARREALSAAAGLQPAIFLDGDKRFWTALAGRIEALAKRWRPEAAATPRRAPRLAPASPLQVQAAGQLDKLEAALATGN